MNSIRLVLWGLGRNASSIEPESAANQMDISRIFFIAYPGIPRIYLFPALVTIAHITKRVDSINLTKPFGL